MTPLSTPTTPPPATVLIATDLSSRSDRALDRALIVAERWAAHLVALTVVEPGDRFNPVTAGRSPGLGTEHALRLAEQRLRADLAVTDLPLSTRVAAGPVTDAVVAACAAERAGLVVTGIARNEAFSRMVLGSTVDALARRSPVPLLMVHGRARTPYRHVVVATDFSAASRHALHTALGWFPEAAFTLFHAFGNPYPALAGMSAARARSDGYEQAQRDAADFLRTCHLPEAVASRIDLDLAYGDVGELIRLRAATHPSDLVVLGTERRRGLAGWLIGSAAHRILEQAENDVLLVPAAAG
jgi:nucleotide-binding universal stress UspA family protein